MKPTTKDILIFLNVCCPEHHIIAPKYMNFEHSAESTSTQVQITQNCRIQIKETPYLFDIRKCIMIVFTYYVHVHITFHIFVSQFVETWRSSCFKKSSFTAIVLAIKLVLI